MRNKQANLSKNNIWGKNNARSSTNIYLIIYYTMQKQVIYNLDDKIQAVQELIDALWQKTIVNEENYLRQFWVVLNTMIEEFAFDFTKKGDKTPNNRFAQYIHEEFLPQYSKMLWFNLKTYQEDAKQKIWGNLIF